MKSTISKALFALCILVMALITAANAQTSVVTDKDGNYVSVKAAKDTVNYKPTGKSFTDAKGNSYPVYISKNGNLFVIRTSKIGSEYRQYLKLN